MSDIEWSGQTWRLRADRSVHWKTRNTLIVADPHFGKADHFRGAGIPVPKGTTRHNLERLDVALRATASTRLVVLGDFFHSRGGVTDELIEQLREWRRSWDGLSILNVRGNHDRQAGDPPAELKIECVAGPCRDQLDPAVAFAHEPAVVSNAGTLCGHLHPAVLLEGLGKARLRAACFHFQTRQAVLPAFGAFTGMKVIRPRRGDRVFAIGPAEVAEVFGPKTGSRASSAPTRDTAVDAVE
ncbi:MAG: ligase-associated DNA damage response endonuclease PdeM [Planctomycetota bacterium]